VTSLVRTYGVRTEGRARLSVSGSSKMRPSRAVGKTCSRVT
jgi:hypothetical protein